MSKKVPVTVFVCSACDRDPALLGTPQAEGRGFLAQVKNLFKTEKQVKVCGVACLGGCVNFQSQTPNGSCCVGLAGNGRHGYVLNQLDPVTDGWKLQSFIKLYLKRPNGRILPGEHVRGDELMLHICTRVPPAKN